MDRGTFFLALVVTVAAVGVGWGVWRYYTDIAPERAAEEQAAIVNGQWETVAETQDASGAVGDSMTVKAFFGNTNLALPGEECTTVFALERRVPKSTAVARAALAELLKGVSAEEEARGYLTSINDGVAIQSLKLADGVLYADFGRQLDEGVGGSCRTAAIRKQIEETAKQFPTVTDVVISVDGRTEDILQP